MGTPNEDTWPGVTALQDWNDEFPFWPPMSLTRYCPGLCEEGLDLLEVNKILGYTEMFDFNRSCSKCWR
jgi:hypothetical protein